MTRVLAVSIVLVVLATQQRQGLFNQIQASGNIDWLERIAGDDTTADTLTPEGFGVDIARRIAYVRLGVVGSRESIAAIRRIEETARKTATLPESMPTGRWPHPAPHGSSLRVSRCC